jgi:ribokinase
MTNHRVLVFGPAYLDRVLLIDRPMVDPEIGGILDRSVPGRISGACNDANRESLQLCCIPDFDLLIDPLPGGWPGPVGVVENGGKSDGFRTIDRSTRRVAGSAWHDDLGGMGAGFAKAFSGELVWLAGDREDEISREVAGLLAREGIQSRPIEVADRGGEWTLLVTSGPFGDKLAVGFRTLGDAEVSFDPIKDEPCDLLVAASMTNLRAAAALSGANAKVRLFAPSIRNMTDLEPKVSQFAKKIDILCCNALEWESLADREEVAWRVSVLVVTDGPRGATIRFTQENGEPGLIKVAAFPRQHPPTDTNRAGEAFASTLVTTLLDHHWAPGVASVDLMRLAAERASAAAALVLDRHDFGFASADEIDEAIRRGFVG